MTPVMPTTVAVVGLGAIGGSIALGLREAGVGVAGFAGRADSALAGRAGLLTGETLAAVVKGAGLVVLAVPPAFIREAALLARKVVDTPVVHVASVQRPESLGFAPDEWRPLGHHPVAGSHRTGFQAADAAMFKGARVSVEARADADERALAQWLWSALGAARVEFREAEAHDRQMAWVSHLPQLAAIALASAVASSGEASAQLGPGGRDATRLAAAGFELWREIVAANADGVAPALGALEAELRAMREAVERGDMDALKERWERARAWRAGARP